MKSRADKFSWLASTTKKVDTVNIHEIAALISDIKAGVKTVEGIKTGKLAKAAYTAVTDRLTIVKDSLLALYEEKADLLQEINAELEARNEELQAKLTRTEAEATEKAVALLTITAELKEKQEAYKQLQEKNDGLEEKLNAFETNKDLAERPREVIHEHEICITPPSTQRALCEGMCPRPCSVGNFRSVWRQ